MKLHEHGAARGYRIQGHAAGEVLVNGTRCTGPMVVTPALLQTQWIAGLDGLDAAALAGLWADAPRIVLLGATAPAHAAARRVRAECERHGAALEVMDLGAACRTFNVLAQEDRPVVALLFP